MRLRQERNSSIKAVKFNETIKLLFYLTVYVGGGEKLKAKQKLLDTAEAKNKELGGEKMQWRVS